MFIVISNVANYAQFETGSMLTFLTRMITL